MIKPLRRSRNGGKFQFPIVVVSITKKLSEELIPANETTGNIEAIAVSKEVHQVTER